MTEAVVSLAAVLLAYRELGEGDVRPWVEALRRVGAEPIVVVSGRGTVALAGTLGTSVAASASAISAVRAGMALLANRPVRLALLVPGSAIAEAPDSAALAAIVAGARATGAAVTSLAGADLDAAPVVIERDAWLDLLTLGEQGLDAVAARRGLHRVSP
jgi:hypothetical protein